MLKSLALLFGCLWLCLPCAAQEVEASGKSGSAVFLPADYLEISVPLTNRITVNSYGFYLGNVGAGIALLEAPLAVQKHFTLTPSYLFVNVPPSGLSLLTGAPASVSYRENQFQLAGSIVTTFRHFTISDRNMYVRRFTPTGGVNRYRNKIYLSHSFSFGSYKVNPFFFDEAYHDFLPGKWLRRNWVVVAMDMPMNRYLTFQPFLTSVVLQLPRYAMPVVLYGLNLIVSVMILLGMWRYASGRPRLVSAAVSPEIRRAVGFRILIGPCVYAVVLALAFLKTWISIAQYVLVPVAYSMPGNVDLHWRSDGSDLA
jgi:hypothetical protein